MSLLPYDWVACAALALCAGCFGPASWKVRAILCAGIGLFGWAASFPLMIAGTRLGYDVALAEDYLNGSDLPNSIVAISLAIAWATLWYCLGLSVVSVCRWIGRAR